MTIDDITTKVENYGTTAEGRLSAEELNTIVEQVKANRFAIRVSEDWQSSTSGMLMEDRQKTDRLGTELNKTNLQVRTNTMGLQTLRNEYETVYSMARSAFLPIQYTEDMDRALTPGVYPECQYGGPRYMGGKWLCITRRSYNTDNDGNYIIEQTAYGKDTSVLGMIYKRILLCKPEEDKAQWKEWIKVSNETFHGFNMELGEVTGTDMPYTFNLGQTDYSDKILDLSEEFYGPFISLRILFNGKGIYFNNAPNMIYDNNTMYLNWQQTDKDGYTYRLTLWKDMTGFEFAKFFTDRPTE